MSDNHVRCIVCQNPLQEGFNHLGIKMGIYHCPTEGCSRYGLVTMIADHDSPTALRETVVAGKPAEHEQPVKFRPDLLEAKVKSLESMLSEMSDNYSFQRNRAEKACIEAEKWKWEYQNLEKFTNDYEKVISGCAATGCVICSRQPETPAYHVDYVRPKS
jgi:hypothetical protein